jgi:hypothetical protein
LPTPFYEETLSFDDDRFWVRLVAVLGTLAAQRERLLAKQAPPPLSSHAPRCSFCEQQQDAVAKIINGPRAQICEACVAAAAHTIGDRAPRPWP